MALIRAKATADKANQAEATAAKYGKTDDSPPKTAFTPDDFFTFLKLPFEIRLMVYNLVLLSDRILVNEEAKPKKMKIGPSWVMNPVIFRSSLLLRTCRQIYDEGITVFWQNHIRLDNPYSFRRSFHASFAQNIQNMEFNWGGFVRDQKSFRAICKFPNLRGLTINHDDRVYDMQNRYGTFNRIQQFQYEPGARAFCKAPGFDQLVQIRGLRSVTVRYTQKHLATGSRHGVREHTGLLYLDGTVPLTIDPTNSITGQW